MKVLFDTNVVLDVLLEREPFVDAAVELLARVENGDLVGYLGATTITTIHYLSTKARDRRAALAYVRSLLTLFEVAPISRAVLEEALDAGFDDFEDAVLYASARHVGVDAIVTRDATGFKASNIPVFSPHELIHALQSLDC